MSRYFLRQQVLLVYLFLTCLAFSDTYTVQPGDTLSKIAQSQLGQSTRWREIAQLNLLTPPYTLSVGQQLQMPADYQNSASETSKPNFIPAPANNNNNKKTVTSSPPSPGDRNFLDSLKMFLFFAGAGGLPLTVIVGFIIFELLSFICFLAIGYRFTAAAFKIDTTFRNCVKAALLINLVSIIPYLLAWCAFLFLLPKGHYIIFGSIILLLIILDLYAWLLILRSYLKCSWLFAAIVGFIGAIVGSAFGQVFISIVMAVIMGIMALIALIIH